MADDRFGRAISASQRLEDSIATVTPLTGGAVYRCPAAPTLPPLNFVRVDDGRVGLAAAVAEARAAARDPLQAGEEEAAARLIARTVDIQQWGVLVGGEVVSVGELYFLDRVAQVESLSTLPGWEGQGFAKAVTAARVHEALERAVDFVFAQIEAGNRPSIGLHESMGFVRAGSRNVFVLVQPAVST